ncbi:MAG: YfcE family phosphodiesterase [Flavobacteriaceae bacterium]|jgi:putative phosphoesterase|uniref:Calcineurin-like phosphoesterase domain-containing protein n=1 Tax=marine metagenome TaxID=408172 RepID=A0A381TGR5_9ZZZZ|nr:YfcE family phosphodiesterase [Flavobacteriaceae bacterium]|tara:strand:+ start:927 stop:1418 length:492 start_codon:yes stop_codon:yes gene_type:complete
MKKILLISDTHGYIDEKIVKYANKVDEIWHAGDIGDISVSDKLKKIKPLKGVYGNIDDQKIRAEFPLHNRFICEKVSVWITHIGGYPKRYNPKILEELKSNPPDLFICGHSHILKVINDKELDLLHMNPGAIGKHGLHRVRTMIQFEINGKKIENLSVIEFKR